jgi:hypothetical protein
MMQRLRVGSIEQQYFERRDAIAVAKALPPLTVIR